jgi:hypothetical protein
MRNIIVFVLITFFNKRSDTEILLENKIIFFLSYLQNCFIIDKYQT